jgi:hypothetical protein
MTASVTVQTPSGPVTTTAAMSPEERFAAVAKAHGVTVTRPTAPAQWHTDHSTAELSRQGTPAHKAAPPSQLPSKPVGGDLAAFDADMRKAGKQLPTEAEEQKFRADAVKWLEDWANGHDDAWIAKAEPKLRQWAAAIQAGTHTVRLREDGNGVDVLSRNPTPEPVAQARNPDGTFAPTKDDFPAIDKAAAAADKDGFAPVSAFGPRLLNGYTLPAGRTYHVAETVAGLRLARIGNLSQAQVEAILIKG